MAQEGSWGFGTAAKQSPHLEAQDPASGVGCTRGQGTCGLCSQDQRRGWCACTFLHVALLLNESSLKEPLSSKQDSALAQRAKEFGFWFRA